MTSFKFARWDAALKQCMTAKKVDGKVNRWNNDPMALNQEAHELPKEKQCQALDMLEEAPLELKEKLSPMWKYCFVQWHIFDAGMEAIDKGVPLKQGLEAESLAADVETLSRLFGSGELEKAATTQNWMWKILEPFPDSGTIEPWNKETAAPIVKVGREERREGTLAFEEGRYDKAYWHFWQGLKLLARAPPTTSGAHAKLRCDLYKNKAAAALKLGMNRAALNSANWALSIDARDEKAWYRKGSALEALGRAAEAQAALKKAGFEGGKPVIAKKPQAAAPAAEQAAPREDELEAALHVRFEPMMFVEVGVDSMAAVDLVMHIQGEMPDTPVPMTLVFDCPTVFEAVTLLLELLHSGNDFYLRRKMTSTVWRAVCKTLKRDPVMDNITGRTGPEDWPTYSEDEALAILGALKAAYESEGWTKTTRTIARRTHFQQRSFLYNLKAAALSVQAPVLKEHALAADSTGLRKLECAIVSAAKKSKRVSDLLRAVRVAVQGGDNGMWAVNMDSEAKGTWDDVRSMQSLCQYTKADPFGPLRANTNSTFTEPIAA